MQREGRAGDQAVDQHRAMRVTDYGRLACGEDIFKEMSEWVLARKGKPLQPNP
jgi:hypothetical protein